MFLLVPLGIFLISAAIIIWVITRKFVYLKKLAPEVIESAMPEQEAFWAELFPELAAYINSVKLREYKLKFLAESEKFLRKLRLLSLKLDSTTNKLIYRVRKSVVHHESLIISEAEAQVEKEISASDDVGGNGRTKDWREEEHKLILEIARNPKDAVLYKKLGNIYMKMVEWRDAAESFKKAIELDPEDETTRNKFERVTKKLEKMPE